MKNLVSFVPKQYPQFKVCIELWLNDDAQLVELFKIFLGDDLDKHFAFPVVFGPENYFGQQVPDKLIEKLKKSAQEDVDGFFEYAKDEVFDFFNIR